MRGSRRSSGFTLVELVVGAMILATAIAALLGAFVGQVTLNEHARNLAWATNDASRVMEQLRRQNSNCATAAPSAAAPANPGGVPDPFPRWDAWLTSTAAAGGGGKSLRPDPANNELVAITCRNAANTADCLAGDDPIRMTIAVCWRHRGRIVGECQANGAALAADPDRDPAGDNNVTESPAMLSTFITCRT
mgnify:FL=1